MRSHRTSCRTAGYIALLFCFVLIQSSQQEIIPSSQDASLSETNLHSIDSVPGNQALEKRRQPDDQPELPEGFVPSELKAAGLQRFLRVQDYFQPTDGPIYRSSSPFYTKRDSTQKCRPSTAEFLKRHGIKTVISLNSRARNGCFRRMYEQYGITYVAVPVWDMRAPTFKDLDNIARAFQTGRHRGGILVWCGYGHGRAGTAITAMQLSVQAVLPPEKRALVKKTQLKALLTKNLVEVKMQRRILKDYYRRLLARCLANKDRRASVES
ncbi:hypothetical protein CDD80_1444 [Ophiocordyceps camponoti-rufipedis]|uniref:Tyrosine specific protein phosphatases domain-containing protein n=1 Tax=Ophiocordyceps camponoti-rufipedis TaxID=2004952 RepID=A0A2C5YEM5_9HYPO|nr:hypothetical protein CDD80_1444 [Ophiocordyceps camponoti-rufipedis]